MLLPGQWRLKANIYHALAVCHTVPNAASITFSIPQQFYEYGPFLLSLYRWEDWSMTGRLTKLINWISGRDLKPDSVSTVFKDWYVAFLRDVAVLNLLLRFPLRHPGRWDLDWQPQLHPLQNHYSNRSWPVGQAEMGTSANPCLPSGRFF